MWIVPPQHNDHTEKCFTSSALLVQCKAVPLLHKMNSATILKVNFGIQNSVGKNVLLNIRSSPWCFHGTHRI